MSIGKYAQAHEDLISTIATAVMGAYVQLQVFVSVGFTFCQGLSIQAQMDGEFGCDNTGCYTLLVFTFLYATAGTFSHWRERHFQAALLYIMMNL